MKPLFHALVVLLACAYLCGCCSLDCRNRNPIREDGSVFDPQWFPPSFTQSTIEVIGEIPEPPARRSYEEAEEEENKNFMEYCRQFRPDDYSVLKH